MGRVFEDNYQRAKAVSELIQGSYVLRHPGDIEHDNKEFKVMAGCLEITLDAFERGVSISVMSYVIESGETSDIETVKNTMVTASRVYRKGREIAELLERAGVEEWTVNEPWRKPNLTGL